LKILDQLENIYVPLPTRTLKIDRFGKEERNEKNEPKVQRQFEINLLMPGRDDAEIQKLNLIGVVENSPVLAVTTILKQKGRQDLRFTKYTARFKILDTKFNKPVDYYEIARIPDSAGYTVFEYELERPINFPSVVICPIGKV